MRGNLETAKQGRFEYRCKVFFGCLWWFLRVNKRGDLKMAKQRRFEDRCKVFLGLPLVVSEG